MVDKLPSLNWFIFKKTSLKLMACSLEFVSVGNPAGSPGSSRRDDGLMPNDIGYGTGFRLAAAPISASNPFVASASTLVRSHSNDHVGHDHSSSSGANKPDSMSTSSVNSKSSGRAIFGGPISAAQEIWPTVYPASGTARVVLNSNQTALSYKFRIKGLDFGELAGIGPTTKATGDDVNGMHIHYAPLGAVGDPAIGLINPHQDEDIRFLYNTKTKYWTITGRWTKKTRVLSASIIISKTIYSKGSII